MIRPWATREVLLGEPEATVELDDEEVTPEFEFEDEVKPELDDEPPPELEDEPPPELEDDPSSPPPPSP